MKILKFRSDFRKIILPLEYRENKSLAKFNSFTVYASCRIYRNCIHDDFFLYCLIVLTQQEMSHATRKPVFGVSNQVRLKPVCSIIEAVKNKGADQTARMCRLTCAFVVRIGQKQIFSRGGSNNNRRVTMHVFRVIDSDSMVWTTWENFTYAICEQQRLIHLISAFVVRCLGSIITILTRTSRLAKS